MRRDNFYIGGFLGFVFPAIGFLLFYLFFFYDKLTLNQYVDYLFQSKAVSAALSLSLILNLPVFFYFIYKNFFNTTRGIIFATLFYGVLILIFKFG